MVGGAVIRLCELDDPAVALRDIETIFFVTSATGGGLSGDARDRFFRRWTGYYLAACAESVFVWREPSGENAAYLTGCLDSAAAASALRDEIFYFRHFAPHYTDYPAHFHINCRPERQGRGLGRALVAAFVGQCVERGVAGVHVVTGRDARNRHFYDKNGFALVDGARLADRDLVLLGRKLR